MKHIEFFVDPLNYLFFIIRINVFIINECDRKNLSKFSESSCHICSFCEMLMNNIHSYELTPFILMTAISSPEPSGLYLPEIIIESISVF